MSAAQAVTATFQQRSIRVKAAASQVYEFWRNFENFPRFMDNVEEVWCLDTLCSRSDWKISGMRR
jgi:uncharacterized membrane protein